MSLNSWLFPIVYLRFPTFLNIVTITNTATIKKTNHNPTLILAAGSSTMKNIIPQNPITIHAKTIPVNPRNSICPIVNSFLLFLIER